MILNMRSYFFYFCIVLVLSSAFNSLYHNILIFRLISIGFNGATLNCLISYQSDRTYYIYILNVFIQQLNLQYMVFRKDLY